jgi:hypothetical protein
LTYLLDARGAVQARVAERAQRDQLTKLKADLEFAEAQRAMYEAQLVEKDQAVQAASLRIDELTRQAHNMQVCSRYLGRYHRR